MEISDIRVKLIYESKERLRAVCSVTFDDAFVVRDVKVVDGTNGTFVAMPSRKLSSHCPKCRHKNQIRARYCNECGASLPPPRPPEDNNGRSRFHRDIAHPINTEFRELLQERVIEAFEQELENAEDQAPPNKVKESRHRSPEREEVSHGQEGREESDEVETGFEDDLDVETDAEASKKQERAAIENEYDSLIAGLNSGAPSRNRGQRRGDDRKRDKDRSEKPKESRSRSRREEHSEKRDRPAARNVETSAPPSQPAPAARPASSEPVATSGENDDNDDTAFGAEILTETESVSKGVSAFANEEPMEKEPAPVHESADSFGDADDDEDGFGAGL